MSKGMKSHNKLRLYCLSCGQLLHNKVGFVILSSVTLCNYSDFVMRLCNATLQLQYTGVCLATVVARLSGIVARLCGYKVVHFL